MSNVNFSSSTTLPCPTPTARLMWAKKSKKVNKPSLSIAGFVYLKFGTRFIHVERSYRNCRLSTTLPCPTPTARLMWVLETWWFTLASTAISLEAQKLFLKCDDFIVLFILPTRRPTTPARHCQKTSWAALSAACSRERRVPWCCPSNCRVGYMTCYFFIIIIYIYIYIYLLLLYHF